MPSSALLAVGATLNDRERRVRLISKLHQLQQRDEPDAAASAALDLEALAFAQRPKRVSEVDSRVRHANKMRTSGRRSPAGSGAVPIIS